MFDLATHTRNYSVIVKDLSTPPWQENEGSWERCTQFINCNLVSSCAITIKKHGNRRTIRMTTLIFSQRAGNFCRFLPIRHIMQTWMVRAKVERILPSSMMRSPAIVHPAGVVTSSLIIEGCRFVVRTIWAAPRVTIKVLLSTWSEQTGRSCYRRVPEQPVQLPHHVEGPSWHRRRPKIPWWHLSWIKENKWASNQAKAGPDPLRAVTASKCFSSK